MHLAPSVSYPVGRCVFGERIWAFHSVCGATLWLCWGWTQPAPWAWWGVGCVLLFTWVLGLRDLRQSARALRWGDHGWEIVSEPGDGAASRPCDVGHVKPVLDLQNTLLLQWQPLSFTLGRRRWLWLTRSTCPEQWLDLRRAVYGSQR